MTRYIGDLLAICVLVAVVAVPTTSPAQPRSEAKVVVREHLARLAAREKEKPGSIARRWRLERTPDLNNLVIAEPFEVLFLRMERLEELVGAGVHWDPSEFCELLELDFPVFDGDQLIVTLKAYLIDASWQYGGARLVYKDQSQIPQHLLHYRREYVTGKEDNVQLLTGLNIGSFALITRSGSLDLVAPLVVFGVGISRGPNGVPETVPAAEGKAYIVRHARWLSGMITESVTE